MKQILSQAGRHLAVAACLLLAGPFASWAKETDSFTHRYEALMFPAGEVEGRPVSDFTAEFNDQFRGVFSEVLAELNEENRWVVGNCMSDRARRRLFHKLSNRLGGPVVVASNRLRPAITRHPNHLQPEMSNSIYQDFTPWRSISLALATKLGHKMAVVFRFDLERLLVEAGGVVRQAPDGRLAVLGPDGHTAAVFRSREPGPAILVHEGRTYRVLDTRQALVESAGEIRLVTPILVSSDKFSHFFNRSLGLFRRLEGGTAADFDRVVVRNYRLEASLWGAKSTGVAAYGDLVANFQGMRFWIHLLGQGLDGRPLADPLGKEPATPIVECSSEGRWVQTRSVDIRDYLDPAWDEGLNCSLMRSPVLLRQVLRRIEGLGRQDDLGRAYHCPVDRALIARTASAYGRFATQVINTRGHSSLGAESR